MPQVKKLLNKSRNKSLKLSTPRVFRLFSKFRLFNNQLYNKLSKPQSQTAEYSMSNNQLASMSNNQLASMSNNQLARMSNNHLASMSNNQLAIALSQLPT